MNNLNERIAKALGWVLKKKKVYDDGSILRNYWVDDCKRIKTGPMPNWAGDLNLMHELEEGLNGDEWMAYYRSLRAIVQDKMVTCEIEAIDLLRATAQQKAEAWLKVKNG